VVQEDKGLFGALWDEYAANVLPSDAGAVQVQDTRRAFYAGGTALFSTIVNMLDKEMEVFRDLRAFDSGTEQNLRKMDALSGEFEQFVRDLAEGRA
jgi:hypothetical protein